MYAVYLFLQLADFVVAFLQTRLQGFHAFPLPFSVLLSAKTVSDFAPLLRWDEVRRGPDGGWGSGG